MRARWSSRAIRSPSRATSCATGSASVRSRRRCAQSGSRGESSAAKTAKVKTKDANIAALEKELAQLFGLKVTIAAAGDGGSLSIHYRTLDQLDEILKKLRADD